MLQIIPPWKRQKIKIITAETFSLNKWNPNGLTSAFLCTKYFGLSKSRKNRSIINISDLGLIAPNQSIYENGKVSSYKPVSYSVIKHGIIGLTKYTSTYYLRKIFDVCSCIWWSL